MKIRSSRTGSSSSFVSFFASSSPVSRTIRPENATSCFANGNKSRVFVTLKNVWNTEIWKELMLLWAISGRIMEMIYIPIPNTIAPKLLKVRWITDARLALRLVPALDKSAVRQDPIFCPSVI